MAGENTTEEDRHERDAQKMASDMMVTCDDFMRFVKEELSQDETLMEVLFIYLVPGNYTLTASTARKAVGVLLEDAYDNWCKAESYRLTEEE